MINVRPNENTYTLQSNELNHVFPLRQMKTGTDITKSGLAINALNSAFGEHTRLFVAGISSSQRGWDGEVHVLVRVSSATALERSTECSSAGLGALSPVWFTHNLKLVRGSQ